MTPPAPPTMALLFSPWEWNSWRSYLRACPTPVRLLSFQSSEWIPSSQGLQWPKVIKSMAFSAVALQLPTGTPGALPLAYCCSFSTSFGGSSASQPGHQIFPLYTNSLRPHPVLWLSITPTCPGLPGYMSSSDSPLPMNSRLSYPTTCLVSSWMSPRYFISCPNLN